ncbi:MAG: hemerythrin domain-containing protein [Pseudobdellovibrionaceae bacterium]
MDIYQLLKKDHRQVKKLLKEIKDLLEDEHFDEAQELFEMLKTEVVAHSKAEEEVFYEPLKAIIKDKHEEELPWEGEQEHHVVSLVLNELSRLELEEEEWQAKIKVLSDLINHHIEVEEDDIFDVAKNNFSDQEAEEIAQNMEEMKEQYKKSIDSAMAEDMEILLSPMLKTMKKGGKPSSQRLNF